MDSSKVSTPAELFTQLDRHLGSDPSRTSGINATFQFDVAGENGGKWWIVAQDGTGSAQAGENPDAEVIIYVDDDIVVQLGNHELDGGEAYVSGLITLEGDHSKAMLLAQIFGD